MAKQIGIDLGSANTLVYLKDEGIVISAPSVIAFDKATGRDLCFGNPAKKMLGKTPDTIRVSKPISEGVVSNMEDTTLFVSRLLERSELVSFFSRPDSFVCVPCKATDVERRAVQGAIFEAGTKNVTLVEEPLAAAIGAGMKVLSAKGRMVVDIGEGTTETAVISFGDIVVSRSQKIAGSHFDRAIINYFRNERRIDIGELTAEKIKIKVAVANPRINRGDCKVIGRNLSTGMVIATAATSREIYYAIKPLLQSVVHQIRLTLEETPPELTSDICNNGIILTGGGALIPGIAEYVSAELGVKVGIAPRPLESVCLGIGKMLDSEGELNKILYK